MGNLVNIFIAISYLFINASIALNYIYWIQVKEYRWDRFRELLKTRQGLEKLISINFFNKQQRLPILTLRIKEIILTTILLTSLLGFLTYSILFYKIIVIEISFILSPWIGILWTTPLIKRTLKKEIQLAQNKLTEVKPKVIGITGSYGKSTTKEFVTQLLSQKYKTESTQGSQNTEFGIARRLKTLEAQTKYFVAEMGAYKIGEIRKLTEIVKPSIGVITGIEPQHLSLFGSLENIKKAKYELIESLPKEGIAIISANSKNTQDLIERAKKENRNLLTYGMSDSAKTSLTISAKIIKNTPSITLKIFYEGKTIEIETSLSIPYLAENLLAAILIARIENIPWEEIKKACKNLKMEKGRMNIFKTKSGATIIDDSYNATPTAFREALDFLQNYNSPYKVVITPGIIELGKESHQIHQEIGNNLKNGTDQILLTSPEFKKDIEAGLKEKKDNLHYLNIERLNKKLKQLLNQNCTILIEGRIPSSALQLIEQ